MKIFKDEEKCSDKKQEQAKQAWQELEEERVNDVIKTSKRALPFGIIPYLLTLAWVLFIRKDK